MKVKRVVSIIADTYVSETGEYTVKEREHLKGTENKAPEIEGFRLVSSGITRKETKTYEAVIQM